jgi:alpha-acetolactate decarboxylase
MSLVNQNQNCGGTIMNICARQWIVLVVLTGSLGLLHLTPGNAETWDGTVVQYGKMHEAIGKQQHHGRVQLRAVVKRDHFFGVGAIEQLAGEITIHDGKITVTRVGPGGQPQSGERAPNVNATILVGAYVPSWKEHTVTAQVEPGEFDEFIAEAATAAGIKTGEAFVFTVEGEFKNISLHVINGACPMHARLNKQDIPEERQPFAQHFESVRGTLVGIFAKNAVGHLTHPGTSNHSHILFQDTGTGDLVTAHVEQTGLAAGSVLRLPD